MDGIIIVDKPANMTSRDVVNVISKHFKTKKVGHTGTLDPLATGVLIVLLGKYTRLAEVITATNKTYEAEFVLGKLTDTLDITGKVLKTETVNFKEAQILDALNKIKGTYLQEVPIYSAVKVNGKKLYEYARANLKVNLPKKEVNVFEATLLEAKNGLYRARFTVSKGTYIRALINDLAIKLGTYGTMTALRRIKQGNIRIEEAFTLEEVMSNHFQFADLEQCLDFKGVEVTLEIYFKIKNGVALDNIYQKDMVLFKYENKPIAIYKDDNGILKMWKYLV